MKALSVVLATLLVLNPVVAYASSTDESPVGDLPVELRTAPIMSGEAAPYSGLLVGEKRFSEFLKAEIDVEDLRIQLEIRTRANRQIERVYDEALEELATPVPWYQRPLFNLVLGAIIGAGIVLCSTWIGIKIVEVR